VIRLQEDAMASAMRQPYVGPEDYLAYERQAETKSEYIDGQVFAMSGASREHVLIAGNVAFEARRQTRGHGCEVYASDMRVRVTRTGMYTYPDVAVVCGEPQFEDAEVDTLLNPTVLVEVLSPSTEAYDRGAKFAHYRRLDSLRHYVLVSPTERRIEVFSRAGDVWEYREASEPGETVGLAAIGVVLDLEDVYADVPLATATAPVAEG